MNHPDQTGSATILPTTDPSALFDLFRGNYATELLTAATCHFDLFNRWGSSPRSFADFCREFTLSDRAGTVLLTALRAFGLMAKTGPDAFDLTPLSREHLLRSSPFDVSGYFGPASQNTGVLSLVHQLQSNRPARVSSAGPGIAFIYRDGIESAMERTDSARQLTLALAGRARNVAPHLAARVDLSSASCLLDVGGGSGLYAISFLQKYPGLRAIVFDRPEVLKVAAEMAEAFGLQTRLSCQPGDMFADSLPEADAVLLSNVLHDWDVPECRILIDRCGRSVTANGQLLIHDVFLNDELDGPLPVALYSAALFSLTEGRAYSAAEYSEWLMAAGFAPQPVVPTLVHCGAMIARKR